MSSQVQRSQDRSRCPMCGADNRCGFSGQDPCWCAASDLGRLEPAAAADTCYCRACLERLLNERARDVT